MVHGSSEVLDENYEGLLEPPSISDYGEFDIYTKSCMTEEQHSEVSHVTKFVSDEIHEEMESIFDDDRDGSFACDISRDLMKVQQVQVSFDVINDSSDYVIMPERNGRLNHISELLIYTQVSGKKYHPPFRLFDNVKGELRAMMNICYFVLFYSTFFMNCGVS